ncbi:MAG TPA: acetyl-CoA carboxylase biotin carboxyl carrier protein subunit [Candidatus Limnocylindrales bacterium]|nr:acetyl-CoA carboxylase biotin carboxyl carrier protein subunit [Candidatus Limnocylindrales bacterium]
MTALRVRPAPTSRVHVDEPIDLEPASLAGEVEPWGPGRAVVHGQAGGTLVLIGEDRPASARHPRTIEVVVAGWRFELEVEDARRADLRARAARGRAVDQGGGPLEIRSVIPGRVAAVLVAAGDRVETGQTLLVIEAMKMQNELRAPRDGDVERVAAEVGGTIELGQVLVVLR